MEKKACVLVVGGAGYIGSHMAMELDRAGYFPIVFDNLGRGHRAFLRWGEGVVGDLADQGALDELFARHKIDAVMHFAAHSFVGESVQHPHMYYVNNVSHTLNLLEAMRRHGVGRFIFSSSCATYGLPQRVPITEDQPKAPISPYGWTKLMVEQILEDYSAAYDLRSISLRYFNAAGADPQARIGEWHDPETHLIPLVLDAALDPAREVRILGTDYPTPDGTCIRDYIHVMDLAQAHLLALEHLLQGGPSAAFNLGSGRGSSVREVIACVREVTGRPVRVVEAPRRPGDPSELVGSSDRIREVLGWRPERSDLRTVVEDAWRWRLRLDELRAADTEQA